MRTTSPPETPFLLLGNGISLILVSFSLFSASKTDNLLQNFQIEAKINCNTTKQNDLKWRKTCTGLKFDLMHFNGPQTKFIRDSLYKHPVGVRLRRTYVLQHIYLLI